jgi:hypothetical protein
LRELAPAATTIAVLRNPAYPEAKLQVREVEVAARLIGVTIEIGTCSAEGEFEPALATRLTPTRCVRA